MNKIFEKALEHLLNKHNINSITNSPDFVLAKKICMDLDSLAEFNEEKLPHMSHLVNRIGANEDDELDLRINN